uniref:Uncharacterized protein n=1 Tax=Arundo donax TaxID=35708 RepID=A0A0A9DU29_ARUDO
MQTVVCLTAYALALQELISTST